VLKHERRRFVVLPALNGKAGSDRNGQ